MNTAIHGRHTSTPQHKEHPQKLREALLCCVALLYGSERLLAESEAEAGARHALAAVRNVDHALLRADVHVLRADFVALANVAHADLTAAFRAAVVVWVYAC